VVTSAHGARIFGMRLNLLIDLVLSPLPLGERVSVRGFRAKEASSSSIPLIRPSATFSPQGRRDRLKTFGCGEAALGNLHAAFGFGGGQLFANEGEDFF